jgi:hypothetical protein
MLGRRSKLAIGIFIVIVLILLISGADLFTSGIIISLLLIFFIAIEGYLRIQRNIAVTTKKLQYIIDVDKKRTIEVNEKMSMFEQRQTNLLQFQTECADRFNVLISEFKLGINRIDVLSKHSKSTEAKVGKLSSEIKLKNKKLDVLSIDVKSTNKRLNGISSEFKLNDTKLASISSEFKSNSKGIKKQNSLLKRYYWFALKKERKEQLKNIVPDLFSYKSVLYVGARTGRFDFSQEFRKAGYDITVVERYKPNVDYLKTIPWIKKVIRKDIREFTTKKKYDVIFWWHGPEHIPKKDLRKTLRNLEKMCNNVMVLGCPNGDVKQQNEYENPYEDHLSGYEGLEFEKLGYTIDVIGQKDTFASNILAVKHKK